MQNIRLENIDKQFTEHYIRQNVTRSLAGLYYYSTFYQNFVHAELI